MNLVALLVALAAVFVFLVDWSRSKSKVPLGLALLTVAWIASAIIAAGPTVTIN